MRTPNIPVLLVTCITSLLASQLCAAERSAPEASRKLRWHIHRVDDSIHPVNYQIEFPGVPEPANGQTPGGFGKSSRSIFGRGYFISSRSADGKVLFGHNFSRHRVAVVRDPRTGERRSDEEILKFLKRMQLRKLGLCRVGLINQTELRINGYPSIEYSYTGTYRGQRFYGVSRLIPGLAATYDLTVIQLEGGQADLKTVRRFLTSWKPLPKRPKSKKAPETAKVAPATK